MAELEIEFRARLRVPNSAKWKTLRRRAEKAAQELVALARVGDGAFGDIHHLADVVESMESLAQTLRRMRAVRGSN